MFEIIINYEMFDLRVFAVVVAVVVGQRSLNGLFICIVQIEWGATIVTKLSRHKKNLDLKCLWHNRRVFEKA